VIEPRSLILPAEGGFHAAFMLRLASGGDLSPAKVGGNLSSNTLLMWKHLCSQPKAKQDARDMSSL
jgi:hypothetical protein